MGHVRGKQMIESYSFGNMKVRGKSHRNDLKIIDDQIVGSWWRREGHALYPEDIDDILYSAAETLVVGTGAYGNMRITQDAAKTIEGRGIKLVAVPTKEAVSIFNTLYSQGEKVAGAFHLTC
jgi:hypothetical protein